MEAKEARYYRALYQAAKAINSTLDPREVLRAIAESTAVAMGAKACSLMFLSPDRDELLHSAAYGLSDWYLRKGPVRVDLSMAEALLGHSVAVYDAGSDPRVQYRAQAVREGIASMLSVPIWLRDEVIGVMRVYTAEPRQFDAEDVEFVKAVANLGGHRPGERAPLRRNEDRLRRDAPGPAGMVFHLGPGAVGRCACWQRRGVSLRRGESAQALEDLPSIIAKRSPIKR